MHALRSAEIGDAGRLPYEAEIPNPVEEQSLSVILADCYTLAQV